MSKSRDGFGWKVQPKVSKVQVGEPRMDPNKNQGFYPNTPCGTEANRLGKGVDLEIS